MFLRYFETKFWWILKLELRPLKLYFFLSTSYILETLTTITREGLHTAIEQWQFFKVPHLLWHGQTLYSGLSEDPRHSHLLPSVWQWNCFYLFKRLRSVTVFEHPTFRVQCERSNRLCPRCGLDNVKSNQNFQWTVLKLKFVKSINNNCALGFERLNLGLLLHAFKSMYITQGATPSVRWANPL